jgi:hypothetical protein
MGNPQSKALAAWQGNDMVCIIGLKTSRPAPWHTQSSIQWVVEALSLRVKWPGHEDYHSPPPARLQDMPRDNVTFFYRQHPITIGFSATISCSLVSKE